MPKVKAKDMTRRDAIPVLERMLRKTSGKRKRVALTFAIKELRTRTTSYSASKLRAVS